MIMYSSVIQHLSHRHSAGERGGAVFERHDGHSNDVGERNRHQEKLFVHRQRQMLSHSQQISHQPETHWLQYLGLFYTVFVHILILVKGCLFCAINLYISVCVYC